MRLRFMILSIFSVMTLVACGASDTSVKPEKPIKVGMANPASKHCVDKGGELKIIKDPMGHYGMCTFPNGSQCEEWKFFRGECKPK